MPEEYTLEKALEEALAKGREMAKELSQTEYAMALLQKELDKALKIIEKKDCEIEDLKDHNAVMKRNFKSLDARYNELRKTCDVSYLDVKKQYEKALETLDRKEKEVNQLRANAAACMAMSTEELNSVKAKNRELKVKIDDIEEDLIQVTRDRDEWKASHKQLFHECNILKAKYEDAIHHIAELENKIGDTYIFNFYGGTN